jgi:uncharacterized integral membrane protein
MGDRNGNFDFEVKILIKPNQRRIETTTIRTIIELSTFQIQAKVSYNCWVILLLLLLLLLLLCSINYAFRCLKSVLD